MTPPPPRILLGITTRNRARVLPQAIRSALAQQGVSLRVAVHDDASSDPTPTLAAQFPQVTWTRSEAPIGYREIRNRWMRSPDCDFFVSLDDDAWFLRDDELAVALQRFAAQPRLAAIAFDILSPDEPEEHERTAPRPTAMFIGCGHMLRLSAVAAVNYYADTPGPYGGEERDLAMRLIDLEFEVELLPGVHVWHDKAWSDRDWSPLHRSGVCNDLCLATQRFPAAMLWYAVPGKILSYLRYWLRRPAYWRPGLAGLCDYLVHFPRIWRHRQPVRRETIQHIRQLT